MSPLEPLEAHSDKELSEMRAWLVTVSADGDIVREYHCLATDPGEASKHALECVQAILSTEVKPWPADLDTFDVDGQIAARNIVL